MSYLKEKTKEESLVYLKNNLDKEGTLTDEFLAGFAGVNKSDFNRRADQLIANGIVAISEKIVTAECSFHKHPRPKIIKKYDITDVIIILSQYRNEHQIKALLLCKLALKFFFGAQNKKEKKPSTIQVPIYIDDLFGGSAISHYETKNISDLDYEEYTEAKIFHMGRIQTGLIEKMADLTKLLFEFKNEKIKALSEARYDAEVYHGGAN